MDAGIAVDLRGGGLEYLGVMLAAERQHVERADDAGPHRLDRVGLVVRRGSRAGEIEDLVDLETRRLADILLEKRKAGIGAHRLEIADQARDEIVEADDLMPLGEQALAQMRAQEPGSTGHKDAASRTCRQRRGVVVGRVAIGRLKAAHNKLSRSAGPRGATAVIGELRSGGMAVVGEAAVGNLLGSMSLGSAAPNHAIMSGEKIILGSMYSSVIMPQVLNYGKQGTFSSKLALASDAEADPLELHPTQ